MVNRMVEVRTQLQFEERGRKIVHYLVKTGAQGEVEEGSGDFWGG